MASTGFINGTILGLYIDGVLVSYSTNFSIDESMDTREVTNKQSGGYAEFRESKLNATGSGDFIFAPDATLGYHDLVTKMQARTAVEARFSSEVSGDKYREGNAYITNITQNAPMEDNVTYNISLQITGKLNTPSQT
jgi:predicted secreted protein